MATDWNWLQQSYVIVPLNLFLFYQVQNNSFEFYRVNNDSVKAQLSVITQVYKLKRNVKLT